VPVRAAAAGLPLGDLAAFLMAVKAGAGLPHARVDGSGGGSYAATCEANL